MHQLSLRPALRRLLGPAWALLIAISIGAPWFARGFWFGTDWSGPRIYRLPDQPNSVAPLRLLLFLSSQVLSAELTGKLLVTGALFLAGLAAYHALPIEGFIYRASAAAIFVFNPYVYGRVMYGQLFLLAGYALLPLVLHRLRKAVTEPGPRAGLLLGLLIAVLGATDLHLLFPIAVLTVATALAAAAHFRRDRARLARLFGAMAVAGVAAALLMAYWTVPFALHLTGESRFTAHFTDNDLRVFQTVPDSRLGLWLNGLGLYGFFGEATGFYNSMKDYAPFWPVVLFGFCALSTLGLVRIIRRGRGPGEGAWAVGLALTAAVSLFMGVGIADRHISGVILALHHLIPLLRGLRESAKWFAMIALAFSFLVPVGLATVADWARLRFGGRRPVLASAGIAVLGLGLPLYYGNGLFYGARGQVRVVSYPASWYRVDAVVSAHPNGGRMLFLPWVLYGNWSFIDQRNPIVACPAGTFFSIPVLASHNLGIRGVPKPAESEQNDVLRLLGSEQDGDWGRGLASLNVEWVVLAREMNYTRYQYLDRVRTLEFVEDDGDILLYRNTLWHP